MSSKPSQFGSLEQQSPQRHHSGSARNSVATPVRSYEISRDALRVDLQERVTYNVNFLTNTLQVEQVNSNLVNSCKTKICASAAWTTLLHVIELANIPKGGKNWNEEYMYQPLYDIFDIIESEGSNSTESQGRRCKRKIVISGSEVFKDEGQGLASACPDMSVIDVDPSTIASPVDIAQVFHRQVASFWEIKTSRAEDPEPYHSSPTKVKEFTAQLADFAAYQFAARPLQIYVIGFALFGDTFRAALFTRSNVYFSPAYNISRADGLEMLIRVVRRLTWDATHQDLGMDPCARLTADHTFYGPEYPSFTVDMMGGANLPSDYPPLRPVITTGFPLWTSLSLLGRGSSVWRCTGDSPTILKVMWRNADRVGEAKIYDIIGTGPGIANLIKGGDVMMQITGKDYCLCTDFIADSLGIERRGSNVVLHRVVIDKFGKLLWEYNDIRELVNGLRAAITGHRHLHDMGIIHQDISPGNVYLWVSTDDDDGPPPGYEGFIADLELASLPQPKTIDVAVPRLPQPSHSTSPATTKGPYIIPVPSEKPMVAPSPSLVPHHSISETCPAPPKSAPGPALMGTAQFIALAVLVSILDEKPIARTVHHDLESFLLVVIYSLYRRELSRRPKNEKLRIEYEEIFGKVKLREIRTARALLHGRLNVLVSILDLPAGVLLVLCLRRIKNQNLEFPTTKPTPAELFTDDAKKALINVPITYEDIYEDLDKVMEAVDKERN
ncbi:hypothetical protein D9615_004941 [Tricholomella constricta]|uniref:Protein kinase domain-containing protein n=1 Tax=Tricholomella constricta TaxID=117010 RepID=A0A8H5HGV1_9AGAR|nr:hypothetical protein D9615_004941 [Tricholomella constricta]